MPPVTAERSPPASRMTGADSPVIADSSTEATPSMISPSVGMISPAATSTTSPLRSRGADTFSKASPSTIRFASVSVFARRSVSACAFPRPSAIASAKFANTTVSHSHNVICSSNPSSPFPVKTAGDQLHGRQHRPGLDDEHHRVLRHVARVQLAEGVDERPPDDLQIPDAQRRLALSTSKTPVPVAFGAPRRSDPG